MKISYLAFIRLPNEKAHGIQIVKVCEALAVAGAIVTLILPGRKTHLTEDPFNYYGVSRIFSIKTEKVPDFIKFGRLGFILSQILFGIRTLFFSDRASVFISQDEWTLVWHALLGRTCVYEVHNGRENIAARLVLRNAILVVANSHGTESFYIERGISPTRIIVCQNGVDFMRFNISLSQDEARQKLGLPINKKIVLYTGHLYNWKGVDTLARSADHLPENVSLVFVGGTEADTDKFRKQYGSHSRILILGHQPNSDIPVFLRAADILALPNNRIGESERFTSPMKLFEYLAAGKPIVASNLPSIREVLNEGNAFFFPAGDIQALTRTITNILDDSDDAADRAARALQDAQKYTWDRSQLLDRINSNK